MSSHYARWARPGLVRKLAAAGLDVEYVRGRGNYLYRAGPDQSEIAVLDLVGGYGAGLFGHNHPALVAAARSVLDQERPQNAQGSLRSAAGELAQRLSAKVARCTGVECLVTLCNSGTEAVEAALKHAEQERQRRLEEVARAIVTRQHEIKLSLQSGAARLDHALFAAASARLQTPIHKLEELVQQLFRHNARTFDAAPQLIAVAGAFHGKTTGSLQLTHRAEFRSPWRHMGLPVTFVSSDAEARAAFQAARTRYLTLRFDADDRVQLEERSFVHVAACFVEPIQGEGGVRAVAPSLVRLLRELCDEADCPLVFDEIQTGMGRTGSFLASEALGVRGDYYVMSKSLGGGLAKLAALLVDRRRYIDSFGYVHSSTFADDDYSSRVGLAALDLLDEDDGARQTACAEQGCYLVERLEGLRARFPRELTQIRGRGLMIGVELADQTGSSSPLLRVLGEQDLLGYVSAGWFLHEHAIRVAPTISAPNTLRLEPSAYIERAELDRFCAALEELLCLLRSADAFRLIRYLVGRAGEPLPPGRRTIPPPPPVRAELGQATRVAFLSHFLKPIDLTDWDTCLRELSSDECEIFLRRTRSELEPFVVAEGNVRSRLGSRAHVSVIALPFTPEEVVQAMRSGEGHWPRAIVEQGVQLAQRLGCRVIGFGGYTSIVTRNCETIVSSEVALTSGNSLTAAAAIDAMFQAAERRGVRARRLGVLGAAGNLGKVLAEVAADEVTQLVLVGRPGTEQRLVRVAEGICADVWLRQIERGGIGALSPARAREPLTGLGAALLALPGSHELMGLDTHELGARLFQLQRALGPEAPIRIATDPRALLACNLVFCASNAARPLLLPEHVAAGPVIVVDVAAPGDVHPALLHERPQATLLKGGIVRLPLDQHLRVDGMNLRQGEVYGCLAETLMLGLAGIGDNFSYGTLIAADVRRARALAHLHGFTFEEREIS
jgi:acetylornithine/succinyldiaminopimelate/putrescine aminotransferase/predicted amino acid dehydrogenase